MMTPVRTPKMIFFVTYHYRHFFKIRVPEYMNVLCFAKCFNLGQNLWYTGLRNCSLAQQFLIPSKVSAQYHTSLQYHFFFFICQCSKTGNRVQTGLIHQTAQTFFRRIIPSQQVEACTNTIFNRISRKLCIGYHPTFQRFFLRSFIPPIQYILVSWMNIQGHFYIAEYALLIMVFCILLIKHAGHFLPAHQFHGLYKRLLNIDSPSHCIPAIQIYLRCIVQRENRMDPMPWWLLSDYTCQRGPTLLFLKDQTLPGIFFSGNAIV